MENNLKIDKSFIYSSFIKEGEIGDLSNFLDWYSVRNSAGEFSVNQISFSHSSHWSYDDKYGSLRHTTGKFFSIEGIQVTSSFGTLNSWEQIIINQPEIGILGIVTKLIGGVRHFLMQAKMEPGNINILQLSPTLQATRSNYKQIHKGKAPAYLEYFLEDSNSVVLIDQLQTEQGGRFLKKRNRNVIIEVLDDIKVEEDYYWLTLWQIKQLMKIDNFVNMDSRSVIGCIPFIDEVEVIKMSSNSVEFIGNDYRFINSLCDSEKARFSIDEIIGWLARLKAEYDINVSCVKLNELVDWEITENEIRHKTENRFSAIFVQVSAGNREVTSWNQPLIKETQIGLIGYLIKKINGIDHFVVQAKMEPGNIDKFELAPSISFSNFEERVAGGFKPAFLEYFLFNKIENVIYDNLQSEEGGRFYHFQNRNMIVETQDELVLPENFIWMTLNQIMTLSKFGMFNIESRSLLSAIDFTTR
ncbi:NDP-hexose 2,3-dehydratase family protein [Aquirufa antheringensis]